MKKLVISIALIVSTTCGLYAQDVKFGIKGGLNLPSMAVVKSTPLSEGYDMRLASGMGIFTELQVTPMVSLRLGVEYSGLGGKKSGMQAMPSMRPITAIGSSAGMGMTEEQQMALGALYVSMPPYYYSNIESTAKLVYVMVPLMAQFGWDVGETPWRVYVNAGPFVSFLLKGEQVAKGTDKMYCDASGTASLWDNLPQEVKFIASSAFSDVDKELGDPVSYGTTSIAGEMKSSNFGLAGHAGLRYQRNHNYFFLEVGGNYGFMTAQDSEDNGSNRLSAISIMVGYAFKLF